MDLRELRLTIRRHLVAAALAFLFVAGLGIAAAYLPARTYAAWASVAVETPVIEGNAGPVQQATFLLPGVVAKAESRSLGERAAASVPERLRSFPVHITATATDSVIRLRGQAGNPVAAAAWVNAVVERLIREQPSNSPIVLTVIDPASVTRRPVEPKVKLILAGSGIAAIMVAIFTALLADRVRDAFDTNQTVRERVGTTVLGEVPAVRSLRKGRRAVTSVLEDGRPPEFIEAFEGIRTNLAFRLPESATTVAVASFDAGSGKSTVSAGLAWSLAAMGREVVLIDADLRRPTLHDRVGQQAGLGLGDVAAGSTDLPYVQPTSRSGLFFVSAGLPSGRAADAVEAALPKAIEHLSTPDRLIIIDSPPLGGASESLFVARAASYVVLVVDRSMVELNHLPLAVARLQEAGAVLLGVVVNRVPRRRFRKAAKYTIGYSSTYRSDDPERRPKGGDRKGRGEGQRSRGRHKVGPPSPRRSGLTEDATPAEAERALEPAEPEAEVVEVAAADVAAAEPAARSDGDGDGDAGTEPDAGTDAATATDLDGEGDAGIATDAAPEPQGFDPDRGTEVAAPVGAGADAGDRSEPSLVGEGHTARIADDSDAPGARVRRAGSKRPSRALRMRGLGALWVERRQGLR